jgi:serine protease AprX
MRLMRPNEEKNATVRSSAVWTKPDETRSSALWGKGGRALLSTFVAVLAFVAPGAAFSEEGSGSSGSGSMKAYLSPGLLAAATEHPATAFDVIVQGARGKSTADVTQEVKEAMVEAPGKAVGLRMRYSVINGTAAQLTGKQVLILARRSDVAAITSDAPVVLSGLSSKQRWPYVSGVQKFWAGGVSANTPTIAIVDSGIQASRADFGGRVMAEVNMTSLTGNSPGDGRGHGTFVAGIAAGGADGYAGAAPASPIVSIDVMDDQGMAMTRDVIRAAEWIYANKDTYKIRVANFSLHSAYANSFMFDPLDKAVEKLWFSGIVVVAAAGNYGVDGQPSGVPFAPGNDPFVITVGADDIDGSVSTMNDIAAPWSAYGYTLDGFAKPDIAAPGRFIIGPVPVNSSLALERPTSVVAPGYIQLSGTSFAAPIVAGAAAQILSAHPNWTPDEVKGALMVSATRVPNAAPLSVGVGVVDVAKAVALTSAPNPNLALNRFLVSASGGSGKVFDAAAWASAAQTDAAWASAAWSSAAWASAAWSSAAWASAAWSSAAWSSAAWSSAAWSSSSVEDAAWASFSYADNAEGELSSEGEYVDPAELEALGLATQTTLSTTTALP